MNIIQPFNQLSISDRAIAGGKGASLGELTTHSFQVPEGFVILTSAFEYFLTANALIAKRDELRETVEEGQWDVAEEIALEFHSQILAASMPEELGTRIDDAYAQLGAELVAIQRGCRR
jgi:pyruvate,water dikinase